MTKKEMNELADLIVDKLLTYRVQRKPNVYDLLNCSTNVLWHKKKSTKADFDHNAYIVDSLIKYSKNSGINDTSAVSS